MNHSAILVDDELAAHYAMEMLLKPYNQINLIGQAHSGKEAVEMINRLNPDLLFLDIQMPDLTGFEVLKRLEHQPYVVFCTAYDQYAIEAFSQNSIDYLLKPVDEKRFALCVDKIERLLPKYRQIEHETLLELAKMLNPPKKVTAIPVNSRDRIIFVKCEQIAFCVANEGYVSLMTDEGKEYLCDFTLKQLEEKLPDDFLRVQKSYIVNKQKIEEIQKYFNNRLILKMGDRHHTRITTGTSYIDVIRRKLELV